MPASSHVRHVLRLYVTLLVIVTQLLALLPPPARAAGVTPVAPATASQSDLPLDLQYALSQELGLDDAGYHLADADGALTAVNASQELRTRFDNLGMQLSANGFGWGVEMAGFGRGSALVPVIPGAQLQTEANRVEFDHDTFTSWYVNGPLGVQQGWTVRERPAGAADQHLTLALLQSGNLRGKLNADGRSLQLVDERGVARLSYGGLVAFDAEGNDLPVRMELVDGCSVAPNRCASADDQAVVVMPQAVQIRVDDTGAIYPITIDPWVQTDTEAKPDTNVFYGVQMAVSGDGATIAISSPSAEPVIYVFTRDPFGVIDTNATARLAFAAASGPHQREHFGRALGMSADGSTIVWGTRWEDTQSSINPATTDNAFVFVRPGATWSDVNETTTLAPQEFTDANGKRRFGHLDGDIAVSADGATIAVTSSNFAGCAANGTCSSTDMPGGAYVFVRPGAAWPNSVVNQTTVLSRPANSFAAGPGQVALSADGSRVAFTASTNMYQAERNGATWSAQWLYTGLTGTPSRVRMLSYTSGRGSSGLKDIAMSSDGTLLAAIDGLLFGSIIGPGGAIDVWQLGPTSSSHRFWITPPANMSFGTTVSISGDGSRIYYPIWDNTAERTEFSRVEMVNRPEEGWPTGLVAATLPIAFSVSGGTSNDPILPVVSADGGTLMVRMPNGTLNAYLPAQAAPTPNPAFAVAGGEAFTLTLTGSGFAAATRVRWNTTTLPITFIDSSTISVEVPADLITSPGSAQITVANPMPGGGAASFTYQIAFPAPVLTGIDPATSYAGEPDLELSVQGSNFAATSVVQWNGEPLPTTFVNNTLLRAQLSAAQIAAVGTADVTVHTPAPGGGTSTAVTHTLVDAPTPVLTGISPFTRVAGKAEFTLTAVGSDFARRAQIFWGDQALTTTYVNATTLTAVVSAALIENEGPVNVTVRTGTPGGGTSAAQIFSVASASPAIADVFPFFGAPAGGTEVTISGTNLESAETVLFGLNPATIMSATEDTLVVQAPAGSAGSVDVVVTTRYGTATALGGFVYADSEPAQPWRDFGDVRVWADNFTTVEGVTTATGKVVIGNRPLNQRLYRVSEQVSWSSPNALVISGTLGFFGGTSLSTGTYDLNTATGAITARAGTVPLISKLGTTNLAISPQLAINALAEQVTVTAALVLALPENPSVGITVRYMLARDGAITADGTTPLALRLAGGTLNAAVAAASTGLTAAGGQLTLPSLAAISLPALAITDSGLQIGAGPNFSLPSINLGNGVLTLKNAQANLAFVSGSYELQLNGVLALANLPEAANNREIAVSGWKVAGGTVQGSIGSLAMTMGGAPLNLNGVSLQFVGERYLLGATSGIWSLPTAWSSGARPTVSLPNPAIITTAPFIRFGEAATFTVPGSFTLGGNIAARNRVIFEQVRGDVRLDGTRWLVNLTSNIRIRLGSQALDGGFYENVVMSVASDTLAGTIANARINIGGMPLSANLMYADTAFSAEQATLTLPRVWKSAEVATGGIKIEPTALRIGPAGSDPAFRLPNISLGIIAFSTNDARLALDGDRYLLRINSRLVINTLKTPAGLLPSEPIELTIKGGRIGGTLSKLQLSVSGFTFDARNLQLVDNIIRSPEVQLQLPSKLSGTTTTLYGLEIGGASSFSVQGGSFKLPDFKMGTVGVKGVSATFLKEGSEYIIAAEGTVEFKKFAVEAAFKIAYSSSTGAAEVRRVMIAFEGEIPSPAVQIGTTGLYFTRISGEFSMEDESLTITLGTRIATPGKVGDAHIFSMDASVTLQLKPSFEFRANADAFVVGMRTASAEVRIWGSGFSLKASAEIGIIRASLEITFGIDAWNEFTFYGELRAEIVIPKGLILDKRVFGVRIAIPPGDIRLAEARLDGGKFRDGSTRFWGARGSVSILGGLYSVNAMARFGRNGGIELGSDIWRYEPVRPVGFAPRTYRQAGETLRDTLTINVTNPGLELTIVEILTPTQRPDPLPIRISSPRGVPFTTTVAYTETDNLYRIHLVTVEEPADMVGTWRVNPALGNEIEPLGLIPPPEINVAELCPVGESCAAAGARVVLDDNQAIDLSWSAKSYTPGLTLEVYATDARGERTYISSVTTEEQELTGELRWQPALAEGSYTVSMEALGATGAPITQDLATIVYADTSAPGKPQGLTGTPEAGLSVLLAWDSDTAEADILGYQVSVNGGPAIEKDGTYAELRSYGLAPGSTHTFAVAAYDLSGNLGEAATVTVTMPSLGVSGNWPYDGRVLSDVPEVWGRFSGVVSGATLTVTDASGAPVLGATTVLTTETLLESLEPGFIPPALDEVGGIATVESGVSFVPAGGQLPPGIYTATISALDPKTQEQVTARWSFQVLPPKYETFLPLVAMR